MSQVPNESFAPPTYGGYGAVSEDGAGYQLKYKGHVPLAGKGSVSGAKRARMNWLQVVAFAVIPCLLFAVTLLVMSFNIHFYSWPLAWLIGFACLLWTVLCLLYFFEKPFGSGLEKNWMKFLFVSVFVAWISAMVLGCQNYHVNMLPFYDMQGLNSDPSVNPSRSGQSHIDIGRMMFTAGSLLDTNMAMGVRIGKTYCVVPVIDPKVPRDQREFDYWAVGTDCCSSVQPQKDFRCPNTNKQGVQGGMRLMSDESRAFYRMAVQEAEATYMINAKHPIFIEWMPDPAAEMASWRQNGLRMYFCSVFAVCIIMLFAATSAGLFFARAAMESKPCARGFVKYFNENPDHDFMAEEGYEEVPPAYVKQLTL